MDWKILQVLVKVCDYTNGHLGMNLTRNGLIVIISLVFVAGAGTAYAGLGLPMITLAGNTHTTGNAIIDGNTDVGGDITIQGSMTCPGGCVGTGDIVDNAVTSADIQDGTITPIDFAPGAENDGDSDPTNELQNWSNLPGIPAGFADGVDNTGPSRIILADSTCDGSGFGWCPDGSKTTFKIKNNSINDSSLVVISLDDAFDLNTETGPICFVPSNVTPVLGSHYFVINCDSPVPDGAGLRYANIRT